MIGYLAWYAPVLVPVLVLAVLLLWWRISFLRWELRNLRDHVRGLKQQVESNHLGHLLHLQVAHSHADVDKVRDLYLAATQPKEWGP